MDEQIYLTIPQTAARMNLSRTELYRMMAKGTLPGVVRFGKKAVRIHRETLIEAERKRAMESAA